ncbi:MAG: AMP-binding protein [Deltaproteobacteria bacterium]|jgi:phenylacetate-coenzyme A ligase PaaK-like adenylate-forming protein|nr:AMP-binding protein [Deltaproteobacteria bacterium]
MLNWLDLEFQTRLQGLGREAAGEVARPGKESLAHHLAAWRLERLAWTLQRARNTAFYRRWPEISSELIATLESEAQNAWPAPTTALNPESLTDLTRALEERLDAALRQLPMTDPGELAANPDLFLAVSHSDVAGVVTIPTSGSTGQAKRIYSSEADLRNVEDFYYFGMRNLVNPVLGDRVALLMSGDRPGSVGDMLTRALGRWPLPCLVPGFPPLGRPELINWLVDLLDWGPTCLVGVPAQVLALTRHSLGQKLAETTRSVLLSGDVAPRALIEALEDELPLAKVFLHYGQTEFGLGGAVECRFHLGPHVREADIIVEIVDPVGRPLQPGQIGEMILTSLSREAMPLIRYRTGDLGAFALGVCPCGSVFRRIRTFGRLADQIVWPDGSTLPLWKISEILYGLPGLVSFQAFRPQPPESRLKLQVTAKNGPNELTDRALHELLAGRAWEITYLEASLAQTHPTGKQILHQGPN